MICRRDNIKLQCKHQPFHAEVAAAVCDIFNGQPMRTTTYRLDLGNMPDVQTDLDMTDTGFRNHPLVPELTNSRYDWSNFIIVVPSMAIRGGASTSPSKPLRSISLRSMERRSGSSSTPPTGRGGPFRFGQRHQCTGVQLQREPAEH